jgi:hypothetical protein
MVTEYLLGSLAEIGSDRVILLKTGPGGVGHHDLLAVLDEELPDLGQCGARPVELGDDAEFLGRVDSLAGAIEVMHSHAVRVVITSIRITVTGEPGSRVGTTTVITAAAVLGSVLAWVRGEGGRDRVGLPDIHLSAARSGTTDTSILVIGRRLPSINIGLLK